MINAIDPNQLLAQMRALQSEAAQQAKPEVTANSSSSGADAVNFTELMQSAVDNVNETQQAAGKLKTAFELGDPNVTLADAVIASQKASVAFEATLQVRNKLVKAYEEVMRMSI